MTYDVEVSGWPAPPVGNPESVRRGPERPKEKVNMMHHDPASLSIFRFVVNQEKAHRLERSSTAFLLYLEVTNSNENDYELSFTVLSRSTWFHFIYIPLCSRPITLEPFRIIKKATYSMAQLTYKGTSKNLLQRLGLLQRRTCYDPWIFIFQFYSCFVNETKRNNKDKTKRNKDTWEIKIIENRDGFTVSNSIFLKLWLFIQFA